MNEVKLAPRRSPVIPSSSEFPFWPGPAHEGQQIRPRGFALKCEVFYVSDRVPRQSGTILSQLKIGVKAADRDC